MGVDVLSEGRCVLGLGDVGLRCRARDLDRVVGTEDAIEDVGGPLVAVLTQCTGDRGVAAHAEQQSLRTVGLQDFPHLVQLTIDGLQQVPARVVRMSFHNQLDKLWIQLHRINLFGIMHQNIILGHPIFADCHHFQTTTFQHQTFLQN